MESPVERKLKKKKIPKIHTAHTGRILSFGWNLPKCLGMPETHWNGLEFCPRWKQGPKRNGIHNIALGFFYMISTTNVVCMKSKLREVVVSTKLTLLKVLAQRFINNKRNLSSLILHSKEGFSRFSMVWPS